MVFGSEVDLKTDKRIRDGPVIGVERIVVDEKRGKGRNCLADARKLRILQETLQDRNGGICIFIDGIAEYGKYRTVSHRFYREGDF
jgi:hypothetical protein